MLSGLQKSFVWMAPDLGEGLRVLLTRKGFYKQEFPITEPPGIKIEDDLDKLDIWLQINAQAHAIEMSPEHWQGGITRQILAGCGPGIVRLNLPHDIGFLIVLQSDSKHLTILNRAGEIWQLPLANVLEYVVPKSPKIKNIARFEEIIADLDFSDQRKEKIVKMMTDHQRRDEDVRGVWTINYSPKIGFWKQLALNGFIKSSAIIALLIILNILIFVNSWRVFSNSVYASQFNQGWFITWCLLLLSAIPLQMLFNYKLGTLGVQFSEVFKGVFFGELLQISKDKIKPLGMGGLLSISIESEIIESNLVQGTVILAVAAFELVILSIMLFASAELWPIGICLLVWIGIYLYQNRSYLAVYTAWVEMRSGMTHELLEKIQGFRTIKMQNNWHQVERQEDFELINYHQKSSAMDRIKVIISTIGERGWVAVGLLVLIPLVVQSKLSSASLMAAIGIIILSSASLGRLNSSLKYLVGALVSWRRISPYLKSEKVAIVESRIYVDEDVKKPTQQSGELLNIMNLDFKYPDRQRFVIEKLSMQIKRNEHVILTGSSGGGKSTLAKLINLTLPPVNGKIFLNGLDHGSWSSAQWRKKIVYVPQFHNNHIFNGTLLFNLLMARRWPPTEEDRDAAEAICGALGLGRMLSGMPQGMAQMLGESGWRISHGEKSRIFIARGLLQYPDLLILDESLAAIDPETTERVFDAITSFTKTCIIIAHP